MVGTRQLAGQAAHFVTYGDVAGISPYAIYRSAMSASASYVCITNQQPTGPTWDGDGPANRHAIVRLPFLFASSSGAMPRRTRRTDAGAPRARAFPYALPAPHSLRASRCSANMARWFGCRFHRAPPTPPILTAHMNNRHVRHSHYSQSSP